MIIMEEPLVNYRQEVKRAIRSVLLPNAKGLLFKAFESEFREMVGNTIDYRRLGYGSLQALLRSSPDVVTVIDLGSGEMLLKAVVSQESAHIAHLVQNQKSNESGYNKATQRALKSRQNEVQRQIQRSQARTRMVPRYLHNEILALMRRYQSGLQTEELTEVYAKTHTKRLEFLPFGFESVLDLLFSMKEVVDVRQIGNHFLAKPTAQYLKQWKEEAESARGKVSAPAHSAPAPVQQRQTANDAGIETVRAVRAKRDSSSSSSDSKHLMQNLQQQKFISPPPAPIPHTPKPPATKTKDAGNSAVPLIIPSRLKSNLISLLADHPEGMMIYELPKKFKAVHTYEFDYRVYCCTSLSEFCLLQPDIFNMKKETSKSDWFLYPVGTNIAKDAIADFAESASGEKQNLKILVPSRVQENVKRTLAMSKLGIPLTRFVRAYTDMNGTVLDVTKYSFENIDEFLKSLDFVVIDQSSVVKLRPGLFDDPFETQLTGDIPEDVVMYSDEDSIKIQTLPEDLQLDESFDVIVGEIYDPGNFYIQLKERSNELTAMMLEMQTFYDSREANRFKMQTTNALVGHYCVSKFDGEWTRAMVKSLKDIETVVVFYFDYGTIEKIRIDHLRFLHKKFSTLPAQGIRARCARILPIGGSWTRDAAILFHKMAEKPGDSGLIAVYRGTRVVKVSEESFISVDLIDTATNEVANGVHLNNELVKQKFAYINSSAELSDNYRINPMQKVVNPIKTPKNMASLRIPSNLATSLDGLPPAKVNPKVVENVRSAEQELPPPQIVDFPPTVQAKGQIAMGVFPQALVQQSMQLQNLIQPYGASLQYPLYYPTPLRPQPLQASPGISLSPHQFQARLRPPPGLPPPMSNGLARAILPSSSSSAFNVSHAESVKSNAGQQGIKAAPAKINQSLNAEITEGSQIQIKFAELCEGSSLHVIEINAHRFVVSKEISMLFPKWKGRDLLAKMIELKNLKFEKLIVTKTNGMKVFEQALCDDVPGFVNENEQLQESVTLYQLTDLPTMLRNLMTNPSESLLVAVDKLNEGSG